jgi:hypothetical protein
LATTRFDLAARDVGRGLRAAFVGDDLHAHPGGMVEHFREQMLD